LSTSAHIGEHTGSMTDPVWAETLTRRLRSLLKTGPFHRLRANETRHEVLRPHDDTTVLLIKALEVLVDALGLRLGAARDSMYEGLAPILEAGDRMRGVEVDRARHVAVIDLVIGVLLNDAYRRQAYEEVYLDVAGTEPVERTLRFRFATEREDVDGSVVLRAEADGINLFLRALDVELEDAQAAIEAALRSQLQRGRFDLALGSAREAQIRSVQYEEQVRALIRKTERDVGRVDWRQEAPRLIGDAIRHLDACIGTERASEASARAALDDLSGRPEARALLGIIEMLADCSQRHQQLQRVLLQAHQTFLREQERQRFAPIPLLHVPSIERDLFLPLLPRHLSDAMPAAEGFAQAIVPPVIPLLLDLGLLWSRLLRPPRAFDLLGEPIEDPSTLDALDGAPPLFDEHLVRRVDERLAALRFGAPLSKLLDDAASDAEARFTVLRVLQHYSNDASSPLPIAVESVDRRVDDDRFAGDELMVHPAPTEEDASHV
jgi:hypothetical protein